jgi:enterochelin esterase family protein
LYVPAQYSSDVPAALMVFLDGGAHYIDVLKTPTVLDNLIQAGDIPVTLGLFIDAGTASGLFNWDDNDDRRARSEQYDSLGDRYSRFLLDEIIPDVVASDYNLVEDPDGWALVGYSSGGIAAFTVGWHHPDRFRKILTHNGSFVDLRGGGAYPEMVRATEPKPLRVYLLSGTRDLVYSFGNWFEANNAMASALEAQGYAFRYRPGSGGHYEPDQAIADFPDALRWLWRGYRLSR